MYTPLAPIVSDPDAHPPTLLLRSPTTGRARDTPTARAAPAFPRVRGYEILSVVGYGGMAIVYEARHLELNRRVAIKMLRGDALADPDYRARFRAEAEAIARLQHPNVIQVFEVGTVEDEPDDRFPVPFLALEFVDGGSLAGHTYTPHPPRAAAKTVETLARAAHAAHLLGVVHRDLKPANVLLTADGTPKVADFGIAKRIDAEHEAAHRLLTRDGTVMGTPEYMAPEQLVASAATPAIDVYALGVILYELLTARVPFRGATFTDTMLLATREDPVPPRRLQPGVPRDLETICLKCLEKSPAKRYESAEALAADLGRWAEGRAIRARAVGVAGRTARWARRNPTVAALSVLVLLLAVSGVSGVVWAWDRARANAARAEANATKATAAADDAKEAAARERWGRYRTNVFAASGALRLHDTNAARQALDDAPEEHRDWVWRLLRAQLDNAQYVLPGRGVSTTSVLPTPDGRWLLLRDDDGVTRVWDTVERRASPPIGADAKAATTAVSADGTTVAFATPGGPIVLWDVAAGRARRTLHEHTGTAGILAFGADGARLSSSSADGTARVWNAATGECVSVFRSEPGSTLLVSPDMRVVAARDPEGVLRLHDLRTRRELASLPQHRGPMLGLRFSPTGDRLVVAESYPSNIVHMWQVPGGRHIATYRGHENQVNHLSFSPDGTKLLTGSMDRTVRVWDATPAAAPEQRRAAVILTGHTGWIHGAAFSPDGSRIVSASHDRTLRYWDAKAGTLLAVLHGHTMEVHAAVYRADGSAIASASADGTVRLWDAAAVERDAAIRGHTKFVYSVAFHPDGKRIASAAWDGTARVWDATSGRQLFELRHPVPIVASVAYHPNGKSLATYCRDGGVRLWDADTGALLRHWQSVGNDWRDSRVTFSPDGGTLAVGGPDGRVRLWDTATGAVAVLEGHTSPVRDVAFSPDGKTLVSGGDSPEHAIRVWDLTTKRQVKEIKVHKAAVYGLTWNPTGTLVVSSSTDGTARLWETATWTEVGLLRNGTNTYAAAFTPDGKLLATACADNLIRVWDVATRLELAELRGHGEYVHSLAFSPDGSRLVSASGDTTLRVWDTLPPQERLGK